MKAGPFWTGLLFFKWYPVNILRNVQGRKNHQGKEIMKTCQVRIEGKVQGVCYRDYTARQARAEGVTGWVRNCADGSVEALISGPESAVEAMLAWFQQGPPRARVTAVKFQELTPPREFSTFQIRFD